MFWIANDFIGNMAAGAGTCGAAYWLVPDWNSDMPDVATSDNTQFGTHMKWTGFAALQKNGTLLGSTPIKSFFGNYATSTMASFLVIGNTAQCGGVSAAHGNNANQPNWLTAIASFAPKPVEPVLNADIDSDMYYPHVRSGGSRPATKCTGPDNDGDYDCSLFTPGQKPACNHGSQLPFCAVTVLDHFTSSFHWAEQDFAAIWLRPQWYLVDNSVLTDVQTAGLTFVTSGTYDRSAVIDGDWAVLRTSVLVGHTQTGNAFAAKPALSNGLKFPQRTPGQTRRTTASPKRRASAFRLSVSR